MFVPKDECGEYGTIVQTTLTLTLRSDNECSVVLRVLYTVRVKRVRTIEMYCILGCSISFFVSSIVKKYYDT